MLEAIGASILVAIVSLIGVFFFGNTRLAGSYRYITPLAVGVFLSLVLFELIPETLAVAPVYGGIAVAVGFILFYILSAILHQKYHHHEDVECAKHGSAMLILIGDAVHNIADGIILGGAFLIDPSVGIATAIGLALHEIPQEIIEFGILVRSGLSGVKAALLNLLSASSIVLGTALMMLTAIHAEDYVWIITGIAAGNLLFLAASDLLPRIHGNLKEYGSVWRSAGFVVIGFVIMTSVIIWTHGNFGHGHEHDEDHREEVHEIHEDEH